VAFIIGRSTVESRSTVQEWADAAKTLEPVVHREFYNREVEMDGKRFENDKFAGVTFIYSGLRPTILSNNEINKPVFIKVVDGPQAQGISFLEFFVDSCKGHLDSCDIRGIHAEVVDEKLGSITPH
jgi:hypothetical protein